VSHVVHSGASRLKIWTHYFSISGGTCTDSTKSAHTEFVFLHLVGFAGHIVHSLCVRVRNVDALFYKLEWDR
jgi:hypothetical protein